METLHTKRKKRKTRRCLDELRKKTHKTKDLCKINKQTDIVAPKNKSCCLKLINCITSNRLTLLNKAVRSETVTRLQLSESTKNLLKCNNNVRETVNSDCNTNFIPPNEYIVNTVLEKQNNITEDSSEIENLSPDMNIHNQTPKSLILFSPESQAEEPINTKMDSSLEISELSSSSSSILDTKFETNYENVIMESLDSYIVTTYPQFLKCDLIDNSIQALKNIYSKYFHNKDNVVRSDTHCSSPEMAVTQNPKDYIGYSQTQAEPKTSGIILLNSTDNNSLNLNHTPFTFSNPIISSTDSDSSNLIHTPNSSPNPIASVVFDSPEYYYYPHRLN